MNLADIEQDFQKQVCGMIRISSEGTERFRIFTPLMFEDGDHLSIVMKRDNDNWIFSDEGHTYMHLIGFNNYASQINNKPKIIANILAALKVEDHEGELFIRIKDTEYSDALYMFIQALHMIMEIYTGRK